MLKAFEIASLEKVVGNQYKIGGRAHCRFSTGTDLFTKEKRELKITITDIIHYGKSISETDAKYNCYLIATSSHPLSEGIGFLYKKDV